MPTLGEVVAFQGELACSHKFPDADDGVTRPPVGGGLALGGFDPASYLGAGRGVDGFRKASRKLVSSVGERG